MSMEIPAICLLKNHDRRLRAGHCWVYSNEVDVAKTPLKGFAAGEQVAVLNAQGKWLGWATVNPNSLICARVVSRDREHLLDRSLLVHRINIALGLRQALYSKPYYRLVYGESDGLPGLVVDRFGDYLSVQIGTAGMEVLREDIVAALHKVLSPKGIVLRNDSGTRALEGLPSYVELALGQVPDRVEVLEGDCRFETSLHEGQKTGWFYDQVSNRNRLAPYVPGKTVLDVFSYAGGWGLRALSLGATHTTCVDASAAAVAAVRHNAELNGMSGRADAVQGDAFEVLKAFRQEQRRFDLIVVDPPAFIKRRKDMDEGALAYRRINEAAMGLLAKDGYLVSASCSHHMGEDHFLTLLQQAARATDRSLQLLERGQQGPDHPVHPAMPETAYLKANYLRVLPTF